MPSSHKVTAVILTVLTITLCALTLIISFTQASNSISAGTTIVADTKYCDSPTVLKPTRFGEPDSPNHVVTCKWDNKNNIIRILVMVANIFFGIVTCVFIVQSNKFRFIFMSIVLAIFGCFTFYVGFIDATSVRLSRSWCTDTLPSTFGKVDCLYNRFILTTAMDFFSATFLIIAPLIIIKNRNGIEHHHHHEHHAEPGQGETSPLVAGEQQRPQNGAIVVGEENHHHH